MKRNVKIPNHAIPAQDKQGVALLIVLGVLSLLLIMALSLSSSMRADLTVSQAHADSVRVRQVLPTAIERTIIEMEARQTHDSQGRRTAQYLPNGGGFAPAFRVDNGRTNMVTVSVGGQPRPILVMSPNRFTKSTYSRIASSNTNGMQNAASANPGVVRPPRVRWQLASDGVRNHFSESVQSHFDELATPGALPVGTQYRWIPIGIGEQRGGGFNPRDPASMDNDGLHIGHFTFVAENMSDYLDMNWGMDPWYQDVDTQPPRQYGTNPLEVVYADHPVSGMSVFEQDVDAIDGQAATYVRFEGGAELRQATGRSVGSYMTNVTHYSLFPAGTNTFHPPEEKYVDKIVISESAIASPAMAQLREAFINLGQNGNGSGPAGSIGGANAGDLAELFIDYNDPDLTPYNGNFQRPSCEPVAMVNELVLPRTSAGLKLTAVNGGGGGNFEYTFQIDHGEELWNAFLVNDFNTASVSGRLEFVVTTIGQDVDGNPVNVSTNAVAEFEHAGQVFDVHGQPDAFNVYESGSSGPTEFTVNSSAAMSSTNTCEIRVEAFWDQVDVIVGGAVVDRVRLPNPGSANATSTRFALSSASWSGAALTIPIVDNAGRFLEVVDPRDNYSGSFSGGPDSAWRRAAAPSWKTTNQVTRAYISNHPECDAYIGDGSAMDTRMYTRNALMRNAGEVGYLPYRHSNASPFWRTVRLLPKRGQYDPEQVYHRVFDYFMSGSRPTRGLINPNTYNANGLAYAFVDMPVDMAPGSFDPGVSNTLGQTVLDWDSALFLADQVAHTNGPVLLPYFTEGDIARSYVLREIMEDDVGCISEMGVEALIRNSMGMMSTRNNVFQIGLLVRGRGSSGLMRAVATVWRDPFPPDNHQPNRSFTHRSFVRSVQFVSDQYRR